MTKKDKSGKGKKLSTISFRGERKLWLEFVYSIKRHDEPNIWRVLSHLIHQYLKKEAKK